MDIKVDNLSCGYNTGTVLRDVSLHVESGETVAIVGPSGSGKTTLLKVIGGMEMQEIYCHKGSFYVDGKNVTKADNNLIDQKKIGNIGYMFQSSTLLPHLTVFENVALPLDIIGSSKSERKQRVTDMLKNVGLEHVSDKLPEVLSGGMKMRVSLARTSITNPKLLLLDEPFSSLDVGWKRRLYDQIITLRQRNNSTIIMVTHDVHEAVYMANRIFVSNMHGGFLEYTIQGHTLPRPSFEYIIEHLSEDIANITHQIL